MKKTPLIIGGLLAIAMVLVLAGMPLVGDYSEELQKEAAAYVDASVPTIVKSWDADELVKRASPELLTVAPEAQIGDLFGFLSERLGPLKRYVGSQGSTTLTLGWTGLVRTGTFVAEAEFEKAPAKILIGLVKEGDRWLINEFRADSPALQKEPAPEAHRLTD